MIDIENEVYTRLRNAIIAYNSSIKVAGADLAKATSFPTVVFTQQDSSTYTNTSDSGSLENHASFLFQIDVYDNDQTKRKTNCKKIMGIVDEEMLAMGFTRKSLSPTPNLQDMSIYRLTARYTGIADKNHFIYRG